MALEVQIFLPLPILMAVWTKAKLAEAIDLRSVVLGGAIPSTATNLKNVKLIK